VIRHAPLLDLLERATDVRGDSIECRKKCAKARTDDDPDNRDEHSIEGRTRLDDSIFTPLADAGLTSLKIQYDWRTDEHRLWAAKEWDRGLDFSQYNSAFDALTLLTPSGITLDNDATHALYAEYGLDAHLDRVLEFLRQGRHVGIEAYYDAERDIRFMCHQHSRKRGLNTKRHAILAGGIRRHPRNEPEIDVIIDGLNLGRAMSFKNVAADLDFGGCKTTVQMDELDLEDLHALGFIAFAIDRCRTMTGPDMNFPTAMADVINARFSQQFTGGPRSPLGESGTPTAYGTFLAMKEAVRFQEGRDSLRGMSAAVVGLGAVGWHLADLLAEGGVKLYVADLNPARGEAFAAQRRDSDVTIVEVEEILDLDADILCPAAVGGIIDEDVIGRLKFRYVFGPANNQLKATSQAEEERLAKLLADRGILFQTEWWHNTAGVMCGAEEYINGANASPATLRARIEATVPVKTRQNLEQAHALGITPTENAYRTCVDAIYNV